MRTSTEIYEQVNAALKQLDIGRSIYPGMIYEEGVEAALRWAMEESDDLPIDLNDVDAE